MKLLKAIYDHIQIQTLNEAFESIYDHIQIQT